MWQFKLTTSTNLMFRTDNGCPILKFKVLFKAVDDHWQSVGGELNGDSHSADLIGLKGGTRLFE
jgi:hypothetical protein